MKSNLKDIGLRFVRYFVVFIPCIVYFAVINNYAVNIPNQDDYDAILDFLNKFTQAGLSDKIALLFSQHNEHRILSSRIVYAAYYYITGTINFRSLILIGNIQLLLTFIMFVSFIKKRLPAFWLIPSFVTSLCLFDLNNWENADFAMASMQNFGIIFLFITSLFFYNLKGRGYLLAAILFQVICTYSSGNGIVASAFLVAFNIFGKHRFSSYMVILVFIICTPLYFFHYSSIHDSHYHTSAFAIATYFLHIISNHIYYDSYVLSSIVGCLLLVSLCLFFPINKKPKTEENTLPFVCIVGFLLASMALVSVFRSGLTYYIPGRYLVYPNFFIAILFVLILIKLKNKKAITSVAILFTVSMLIAYNMNFRGGLKQFATLKDTLKNKTYNYPNEGVAKAITERSCQLNIYCIGNNR